MVSGEKQDLAETGKQQSIIKSPPANPFTRVDTVIVRVSDLDEAKRWYEEKLGFEASSIRKGDIVVFKTGGETSITIYNLKPGEKKSVGKTPSRCLIFYAADADKAHRQLKERGVKVGPVVRDEGQQWFSFWDFEENQLEVCHW